MTLDDLIDLVAARVPSIEDIASAELALSLSRPDLFDSVSKTTALRFVEGGCSFELADTIVNNLFAFAQVVDGRGLPELAHEVYLAFDAGEYEHAGDPPELQGEHRTRRLLARIGALELLPPPPEDPAWREAYRNAARVRAVSVAKQVLEGQLGAALGALELCSLRSALGVPAEDSDFEVFILIDSESHALPIGPVRQHWAPEALRAKDDEVRGFEVWALETGQAAFRSVVARFDPRQ